MNATAGLNFQILNFPVRIHISFFLIAVLLGLGAGNILFLVLWVLIVLFSILLHELGHAIVGE